MTGAQPGCDCKPKTPLVKQVLRHSQAKGSARLALLVIAAHYGKDSVDAWPGLPAIAELMGDVTPRTAMRAVLKLEQLGEVVVRRTPGCGNRYELTTRVLHDRGTGVTADRGTSVTPDTSVTADTPPASGLTPHTRVSHDTLSTKVEEPLKSQAAADDESMLRTFIGLTGRPLTPKAADWLRDLAAAHDPQAVVEAMQADTEPRSPGLIGRTRDRLEARKAPRATMHDGSHSPTCMVCHPEAAPQPASRESEISRKAARLWITAGSEGTPDDYREQAERLLQQESA